MTFAKTAVITAGFAGAFALGVWTGPQLTSSTSTAASLDRPLATVEAPPAQVAPIAAPRPRVESVTARRATTFAPLNTAISPAAPELHSRLKPYLKSGANMEIASEGFRSAEQFATVVHASQNVNVPFMLLKHRVLEEGDTLVAAIRKSKRDVDAIVEADRARAEARSDIASLD